MSDGTALVRISVGKAVIEISGSSGVRRSTSGETGTRSETDGVYLRALADAETEAAKEATSQDRETLKKLIELLHKQEEQRQQVLRVLAS